MATNYSPTIVTDGIVEAWDPLVPSTNTSATLLYDRVGSTNGTMFTGTCVNLDGTDDYVNLGSIAFGTKDISISTWFTLDAFDDDYACIFNNRTSSAGNAGFEIRQRTSGTKIELQFDWGAGSNAVSTGALSTGTWYHIVATLDRSGYLRGYLNGVEFGTPLDISSYSAISITNDNSAFIGVDGHLSNFWNGRAGDLKIYENTVLSASQVKEIYNSSKVIIPSNVSQTNLMGWWTLVEGVGTIAYDGSGNGRHGTLTNGLTWILSGGAPALVGGFNGAMLFDGAAHYINCGASNALVTGTTLSFSAWVLNYGTTSARVFQAQKAAGSTVYSLVINASSGSDAAGYVSCLTWNGTGHDWLNYNASIDDGAWHHLVMTTTASAQKLYVDGVSVASSTSTFSNTVSGDIASIGSTNGTAQFLDGLINEVVLYDSELSLAQVQALAATGPNGGPLPPDAMSLSNSSDIVAYWRNDGAIAYNGSRRWADLSGNGHTGSVTGADSLIFKQGVDGNANVNTGRDNQGFPLLCKDVGATGYNGTNYYINLGNSAGQIAGLGSLDAWVYPTADKWMYFFIKGYGSANSLFLGGHTNAFGSGKWGWFFGSYDGGYNYHYWGTAGGFEADYANRWHYLAMTFNKSLASANWKVYWNGEYNSADNWTSDLGTGTPSALIGGSRYWAGQIGPIRTYNRVLSPDEIQQNYNAQKSRFT